MIFLIYHRALAQESSPDAVTLPEKVVPEAVTAFDPLVGVAWYIGIMAFAFVAFLLWRRHKSGGPKIQ